MTDRSLELAIVDVSQIAKYTDHLRLRQNPAFSRLKRSIRSHGLQQPLVVSPRAGGGFIVGAGGNTRLEVLQELQEESGQPLSIPCVVQKSTGDNVTLLAHLRENDLRGRLTFIERALAVEELKGQLNLSELPLRKIARALDRAGFPVPRSQLPPMRYAATRLYPVLREALENGLGRPAVESIQRLERAGVELWIHWKLGDAKEFADIFSGLCDRQGMDLDLEALKLGVVNEIGHAASCSESVAQLALDHVIEGESPPDRLPESERHAFAAPRTLNLPAQSGLADVDAGEEPEGQADRAATTPKRARPNLYALAQWLADSHGFGLSVAENPQCDAGFAVSSPPSAKLKKNLEPADWHAVCLIWWILRSLSGPGHSDDQENQVECPMAFFGPDLVASMDGEVWRRFLALLHGYRALHRNPAA